MNTSHKRRRRLEGRSTQPWCANLVLAAQLLLTPADRPSISILVSPLPLGYFPLQPFFRPILSGRGTWLRASQQQQHNSNIDQQPTATAGVWFGSWFVVA